MMFMCVEKENIVVNVAYDLFDGIYELSQVVIIFLFFLLNPRDDVAAFYVEVRSSGIAQIFFACEKCAIIRK